MARRVLECRLDPEKSVWDEESQAELAPCIDAHSFRGNKLVQTVADLSGRLPLTVLPYHREEAVSQFLRNMPEDKKERLTEIGIDMDHTLLSVVEKELPEVRVALDHFHVTQDANRQVDEAREIEQDAWKVDIPRKLFLVGKEKLSRKEKPKVDSWCQKYASLKEFYWIREALQSFYRLKRKNVAEKMLKDLIKMVRLSDDGAMMQWNRTLKKWSRYILNYFGLRTTNTYTEGIHTKIKMTERVSFGFRNVEIYVRKVLVWHLPLAVILPLLPHFSS